MFLQGRAGTGKTFLTNQLINLLISKNKHVLVSGSTGMAASQYIGGVTVHSLFSLGMDHQDDEAVFKCNIGHDTYKAAMLRNSDLIIIDEISMLTVKVATKVDYTLRFLCYQGELKDIDYDKIYPFGGKNVLFVGDLLQLQPVMPNNNSAVAQKLITKCSWWSNVKLYGLTEPMRCKNEKWNDFIKLVANNEVDNLKWNDIEDIKITRSQTEAEKFYLEGYEMSDNFPLDRQ